jgi:nucleoside 2-deoxyribosyltransferase
MGYKVLYPLVAKGYLRISKEPLKAYGNGEGNPVSSSQAIIRRDHWMVINCDVCLVDLTGAKAVSIGCVMELAWAYDHSKHTILVMEADNIHQHSFVKKAADIIFTESKEAYGYLEKLIGEGI